MEYVSQDEMITLLHNRHFDMLCWLKKICDENHLHMYLWGGTLIGAVRHNDLIPWDDDIDIVMFESDYLKLKEVIKNYENDLFELIDYHDENYFYTYIPRIIYKNSYLPGEQVRAFDNIFMDIFLLNKTSNNKISRSWHGFQLKTVYGLALGHRSTLEFNTRFKVSFINNISAKFLQFIGKRISLSKIYKWHDSCARKYDKKNTKYVFCTNNAPTCLGEKHSHPATVYQETIQVPFRTSTMPVPSGYDVILKSGYGDYMTLPPVEKQVMEHASLSELIIDGKKIAPESL